jgi:hypothetical protein
MLCSVSVTGVCHQHKSYLSSTIDNISYFFELANRCPSLDQVSYVGHKRANLPKARMKATQEMLENSVKELPNEPMPRFTRLDDADEDHIAGLLESDPDLVEEAAQKHPHNRPSAERIPAIHRGKLGAPSLLLPTSPPSKTTKRNTTKKICAKPDSDSSSSDDAEWTQGSATATPSPANTATPKASSAISPSVLLFGEDSSEDEVIMTPAARKKALKSTTKQPKTKSAEGKPSSTPKTISEPSTTPIPTESSKDVEESSAAALKDATQPPSKRKVVEPPPKSKPKAGKGRNKRQKTAETPPAVPVRISQRKHSSTLALLAQTQAQTAVSGKSIMLHTLAYLFSNLTLHSQTNQTRLLLP